MKPRVAALGLIFLAALGGCVDRQTEDTITRVEYADPPEEMLKAAALAVCGIGYPDSQSQTNVSPCDLGASTIRENTGDGSAFKVSVGGSSLYGEIVGTDAFSTIESQVAELYALPWVVNTEWINDDSQLGTFQAWRVMLQDLTRSASDVVQSFEVRPLSYTDAAVELTQYDGGCGCTQAYVVEIAKLEEAFLSIVSQYGLSSPPSP